ncbi:CoA pyrophosphatase [Herbaspirillum sp. WKF16]|uniref:CoA pyrophosphatase n=1 Tax=Herbaspirillum sp. WKF16 TaxID=3028312 RepID=UPI0023AA0D7D|nr:CoA pyrophosphatase [Herbaspirillum sp. WKF16]WDZ94885.1 CoA pyrophosphatase [Herbaspirillum sp. WKF16]
MASFDPVTLPVDAVAGERALDAARLNADWLRRRFSDPPRWEPEHSGDQLARMVEANGRFRLASVLIPIVLRPEGLTVLFTQRTADLKDHAGQISFPGGRREDYDGSAIETALRETEEEIGLGRGHVEVIGSLPDYFTGTGYRVTPVAGLIAPPFDTVPESREVAEIFEVPLAFLMDGLNHQRRSVELPQPVGRRSFYTMPYQRYFIWGATAGMLRNLFHFLRT